MTAPRKYHPYYKFDKIMSYNAYFNMIVGVRGVGKTYGAKKRVVRNAIRNGEEFIYLRRYKTELSAAKNTFFTDIGKEFPKHDFRVNRNLVQYAHKADADNKKREWKTIGYFFALSTAQSLKSVSFENVTTIVFDEFIIEKGAFHYLPNEADVMINFYNTVDRNQDKTKVFFLANSVSIMNPYFQKWKIEPDAGQEWVIKGGGYLVCHFPESKAYQESVYQTAFGKFINGTDYAAYAVGNQFADNNDSLLGDKGYKAKYRYTLETEAGTFSVWHDSMEAEYYVQEKLPKEQLIFTLVSAKMDSNKILVNFNDAILSSLRTAFRQANVVFDSPTTRNVFAEIFKR